MTSLAEIEAAIVQLPKDNARQLAQWLQNYIEDQWDQQIEADVADGKLDALIARAETAIATQTVVSRKVNVQIDRLDPPILHSATLPDQTARSNH